MKIGIVGLGYVGLPLACLFAKKYSVIGYDIDKKKIELLYNHIDYTDEVGIDVLQQTYNSTETVNQKEDRLNFGIDMEEEQSQIISKTNEVCFI